MSHPYRNLARGFRRLMEDGRRLPLGDPPLSAPPRVRKDVLKVLLLSPHPDDECIVGGLALRLLREAHVPVFNVAVTLGSNRERRAARWDELDNACRRLGFERLAIRDGGLERVTPACRQSEPELWRESVAAMADLLARERPAVLFMPHAADWNGTHIGVHDLTLDALRAMPATFHTTVIETEYWAPMNAPNLMVELGIAEVGDLMAALSCHVGEVRRNPYHLTLPAWMMDNVRRGGELVGGQGGTPPPFDFATLYRAWGWTDGEPRELWPNGRLLPLSQRARILWQTLAGESR